MKINEALKIPVNRTVFGCRIFHSNSISYQIPYIKLKLQSRYQLGISGQIDDIERHR